MKIQRLGKKIEESNSFLCMSEISQISPYCILADNDQVACSTLDKLIQKMFPSLEIIIAHDGKEALRIFDLNKHRPLVIISELKLPALDGRQLLNYIKGNKKTPTYMIAFTVNLSQRGNLELLQSGIDDILLKPIQADQVVARLRSAMKHILLSQKLESIPDEDDIKKSTKKEMALNVSKLLNSIIAKKGLEITPEQNKFWTEACKHIYNKMEGDLYELAATINALKFVNVYKLFLEESKIALPVMKKGFPSHGVMEEYPGFIRQVFSYLPGLEQEREILLHIYENLDGTGIPDKMRYWHIPLGSRLLRILIEYGEALKENKDDPHKSIDNLYESAKRLYDHNIIIYLDQFLAENYPDSGEPEESIEKNRLREGYVLSRNIITRDGLMLMPRKTKLEKQLIKTIWTKIEKEGMVGSIYIFSSSKKTDQTDKKNKKGTNESQQKNVKAKVVEE